jgi:hypothetical protein
VDSQPVLRADGGSESTQGNIQDWLQLDEGDPGFQLLTEEEIGAVILFYYLLSSALPILINSALIYLLCPFCHLGISFASLIRIID